MTYETCQEIKKSLMVTKNYKLKKQKQKILNELLRQLKLIQETISFVINQ